MLLLWARSGERRGKARRGEARGGKGRWDEMRWEKVRVMGEEARGTKGRWEKGRRGEEMYKGGGMREERGGKGRWGEWRWDERRWWGERGRSKGGVQGVHTPHSQRSLFPYLGNKKMFSFLDSMWCTPPPWTDCALLTSLNLSVNKTLDLSLGGWMDFLGNGKVFFMIYLLFYTNSTYLQWIAIKLNIIYSEDGILCSLIIVLGDDEGTIFFHLTDLVYRMFFPTWTLVGCFFQYLQSLKWCHKKTNVQHMNILSYVVVTGESSNNMPKS